MIIAFVLMAAAVILVFLYGVLVATRTEEDQYLDDWAQLTYIEEWRKEYGKEETRQEGKENKTTDRRGGG